MFIACTRTVTLKDLYESGGSESGESELKHGNRVGRRLHDGKTGSSVHCRAHDHHVLGDIRDGRHRQFDHLHGDSQTQVYAHGHQLLFIQSSRVRSHTACVRVTAGNVVDMVQVSENYL